MPRTGVARGVGCNGPPRMPLPTGVDVNKVCCTLAYRYPVGTDVPGGPPLWRIGFSFRPRSQTALSPFDPRFARISATLRMTRTKGSGMRAYRYPVGGDVPTPRSMAYCRTLVCSVRLPFSHALSLCHSDRAKKAERSESPKPFVFWCDVCTDFFAGECNLIRISPNADHGCPTFSKRKAL